MRTFQKTCPRTPLPSLIFTASKCILTSRPSSTPTPRVTRAVSAPPLETARPPLTTGKRTFHLRGSWKSSRTARKPSNPGDTLSTRVKINWTECIQSQVITWCHRPEHTRCAVNVSVLNSRLEEAIFMYAMWQIHPSGLNFQMYPDIQRFLDTHAKDYKDSMLSTFRGSNTVHYHLSKYLCFGGLLGNPVQLCRWPQVLWVRYL